MFWLKFTPSNWACFRSSIRTNYNEEGRKEGRKMKTLGRFWNANQGGGGIQKYQQGWECSFPQLSSFFLSSNRFLPCTAGFFVLTDHKYLILVLAQMVEHSDRQQKKKDPVKIKVRMVQAPVPPELVTAWESVWNGMLERKATSARRAQQMLQCFPAPTFLDLLNVILYHIDSVK